MIRFDRFSRPAFRVFFSMLVLVFLPALVRGDTPPSSLRLLSNIPIPVPTLTKIGFIDQIVISDSARTLYAGYASENSLLGIDLKKNEVKFSIPELENVRGVAIASEYRLGFTSNRRGKSIGVIDLKSSKLLNLIEIDGEPDAILYVAKAKVVYVTNSVGNSGVFIDPETQKIVANLPLGGKPERAAADPATGLIYQALSDTAEIVVIDPISREVARRFPVEGGQDPTGLSFDLKSRRLFIGCQNEKLVVMNVDTGAAVATLPVGKGANTIDFDSKWKRIYVANAESQSISVIEEVSPDRYELIETVPSSPETRSLAIDPRTHRIYLSHLSGIAVYEPKRIK